MDFLRFMVAWRDVTQLNAFKPVHLCTNYEVEGFCIIHVSRPGLEYIESLIGSMHFDIYMKCRRQHEASLHTFIIIRSKEI